LVALRCRPLHRGRHPVPTRRSSDLPRRYRPATIGAGDCERIVPYNDAGIPWTRWCVEMSFTLGGKTARELGLVMLRESQRPILRSEEHTSELQSRENLVCRLLLAKR